MSRKLIFRTPGKATKVVGSSAPPPTPTVDIRPLHSFAEPVVSSDGSTHWIPVLNEALPEGCARAYRVPEAQRPPLTQFKTDRNFCWFEAYVGNYDVIFFGPDYDEPPRPPTLDYSRTNHLITSATRPLRNCRFLSRYPVFTPVEHTMYISYRYG